MRANKIIDSVSNKHKSPERPLTLSQIIIKGKPFRWVTLAHDFCGVSAYPPFSADLYRAEDGSEILDLVGNWEFYLTHDEDLPIDIAIPYYVVGNKLVERLVQMFKNNEIAIFIDLVRDYTLKFNELSKGEPEIK